jgi:hypothetical protein
MTKVLTLEAGQYVIRCVDCNNVLDAYPQDKDETGQTKITVYQCGCDEDWDDDDWDDDEDDDWDEDEDWDDEEYSRDDKPT